MFKRLLVVMLTMALIVGLCSMAMATKDPNGPKTYLQALPEGNARTIYNAVDFRPTIPAWTFGTPALTVSPVSGQINKAPAAGCVSVEYDCGAAFYVGTPSHGQAVRYSTGSEICQPITLSLAFLSAGHNIVSMSGVDAGLWADDGFGLPGAVLYSVNVPHGSIVDFPVTVDVDLVPSGIVLPPGTEYHAGQQPTDPLEHYAMLIDDGSCGQGRSSYWDGPGFGTFLWYPMPSVFGGTDYNWVQALEVCCSEPPPTTCTNDLFYGTPAFFWPFQDGSAVRYKADPGALQCQVTEVYVSVFDPTGFTGWTGLGFPSSGGINVNVWADDGSGLPGAVLGTIFVDHASVAAQTFPSQVLVDFTTQSLLFPAATDFHIGYAAAVSGDEYPPVSDDGGTGAATPGVMQSSAWLGTAWEFMAVIDAPFDDNWLHDAVVCCEDDPQICANISYAGSAFYYWPEPDPFDDTWRNQRFSLPTIAGPVCTLKVVRLAFDAAGSIGGPGADVFIWNSDGTFPSTVVTTIPVNPVVDYFPAYTEVDVSAMNLTVNSDWHVGCATILNDPSDVLSLLSDNGGFGTGRSSEYWPPASGGTGFELMAINWGVDVNFLIETDVCCVPPGFCPITCSATDQWPIFNHDFARTGQSEMFLGDLCGVVFAWTYAGPSGINWSGPVISDDLVLQAFDDRVQAINLLTGVVVWDTDLIPAYATVINTALRAQITIHDGFAYFGTGGLRGFAKADLATGALQWARGLAAPGGPLPGASGNTRFAGSIIMGPEIYFGNEAGEAHALDIATGLSLYNANLAALAPTNGGAGGIYGPPSTDGSQIFWGVTENLFSAGTQNGAVVSTSQGGGAFVVNWVYDTPFDGLLNLGLSGGTSYRCEHLYINMNYTFGNFSNYSGLRKRLETAGGTDVWPDNFLMGSTYYNPVSTTNELVYYGQQDDNFSQGNVFARGVRAVNFNNSTVWLNGAPNNPADPFNHEVFASVSVTCDPYAVYTTTSGLSGFSDWNIVDGNTGASLVTYLIPTVDIGHYTAIAWGSDGSPYFVVSRGGFTATGDLFTWRVGGPRPRLAVPNSLVLLPGTNTSEASPVQRTDTDAIVNTGCATLTYDATLEAGTPPSARVNVTTVNPELIDYASNLSNSIVDVTVSEMMGRNTSYFVKNMSNVSFEKSADGELARVVYEPKAAASNSRSVLAPPTWVTWINPPSGGATVSGSLLPGDGADWTWEFDRSGMNFLAPNTYFVEVNSNDPDFNFLDPLAVPQTVIEYRIAYEYCPVETGFMNFGTTGQEWYSNRGEIGDADIAQDFAVSVGVDDDDPMYEGSMFFMTSMDDAAWNPFGSSVPKDFGFLYPFYIGAFGDQDCGGCDFGVTLPVEYTTDGGNVYNNTIGDLCSFAMIDSLQAAGLWPHQAGPSIGLLIKFREVGTYGADFDGFKLIVVDVENRNASAVTGLYYGTFVDWDPSGGDNGGGDPVQGYVYEFGNTNYYGTMGIPASGSYWPDGTKTDPMYSGYIVDNPSTVYPSAPCPECLLDSLFAWVDDYPEDGLVLQGPQASDMSIITTYGKADLAGNASTSYGFAIFGFINSADIDADATAMQAFVNKYAGFARGDINDDGLIDLRDLVRLSNFVASGTNGPEPFKHLGDVDNDGDVDSDDCSYLAAYYFMGGAPPQSDFMF